MNLRRKKHIHYCPAIDHNNWYICINSFHFAWKNDINHPKIQLWKKIHIDVPKIMNQKLSTWRLFLVFWIYVNMSQHVNVREASQEQCFLLTCMRWAIVGSILHKNVRSSVNIWLFAKLILNYAWTSCQIGDFYVLGRVYNCFNNPFPHICY